MTFLTKLYNWVHGWKWPFLSDLIEKMQALILQVSYQIGREAFDAIKGKIIEVSTENISGDEKWQKVFDFARTILTVQDIKDRWLDLLIVAIVNILKDKGEIK